MKKIKKGFGLLEAVIAVAAIAVVSTVGFTTYQDHVLRTQEEVVKQDMMQLMGDFQTQYTKTGAFSDSKGNYNEKIVNEIKDFNQNSKYFEVKIFPQNVEYAHQKVCLVSNPKPDTIIANKATTIAVDNFGAISSGTIPDYCNGVEPGPEPASCKWETTYDEDSACYCSFKENAERKNDPRCQPEPEPEECTESTPYSKDPVCYCKFNKDKYPECNPYPPGNGCYDFYVKNDISNIDWFKGDPAQPSCHVDSFSTYQTSGNCNGKKVLGGCSGSCNNAEIFTLLGGNVNGSVANSLVVFPDGASSIVGSASNSTLCNAACTGSCSGSTIIAGSQTSYPLMDCTGSCANSTLIATGNRAQHVVSCKGACFNIIVKIPKSWGNPDKSFVCQGSCAGVTIEKY